jgi:DNA-binding PadR family transcriptional regulator
MSEAGLLALVTRYAQPSALARRAGTESIFPALRRLECDGLVTRRRGTYRLTQRGRNELGLQVALTRAIYS